jgi:hypothetical protein
VLGAGGEPGRCCAFGWVRHQEGFRQVGAFILGVYLLS